MAIFKHKIRNGFHDQEIELEDIFMDKVIQGKSEAMEIWERKLEVPLRKRAFWFLWGLVLMVSGILLYICFTLQVQSYSDFKSKADNNKFMIAYLSASRGIIYDQAMEPLVKNEASFDLWVKKSEMSSEGNEIEALASIVSLPAAQLQELINQKTENEFIVKKNLNHEELILFEAKQHDFPGFYIQKGILRVYESEKALGPILGYLGKIAPEELSKLSDYQLPDEIGKEGLEKFYEDILREQKGKFQIERNAKGEEISKKIIEYPKSGNSLVLSIELDLQEKIIEVLGGVMQDTGTKKAAVVAINPQNGEVLASVSLPSFDNNLFASGISAKDFKTINENPNNPQLNRIIAGLYPTGSTIKPFIASAALEEKVITEDTQLWCPLKICLENKYTGKGECFVDNKFHGTSDVRRAIAESVNPFFYLVGGGYTAPKRTSEFFDPLLPEHLEGLGVSKIEKYLNLFGFGTSTGIDLPGEAPGRVPSPTWKQGYFNTALEKIWFQGDTYNLAIGQGYFLATPLQVAVGVSTIANEGKLIKPHLVKKIMDAFGNTIQESNPDIIRENFISPHNLQVVREGMRQTVNSPAGSALSLNSLPIKVAAKTGTAQIGKKDVYENWIAAFAPYGKPEIVLVILLEEVPGIQPVAQRTAREILDWYFLTHPVSNP
ncbi:MAG: penicillin-binding protein 2 [Candidatus Pacebacteria bacterium]|nr:penicillin-binding protein 2 [Candidatus Paceibacterota bacterium]